MYFARRFAAEGARVAVKGDVSNSEIRTEGLTSICADGAKKVEPFVRRIAPLIAAQTPMGRLGDVDLRTVADQQRLVPPDDPLIEAARSVKTCFGD